MLAYATIKKRESFAFTLIYFLHLSVMSCPCLYLLPCRNYAGPSKIILPHLFYLCIYRLCRSKQSPKANTCRSDSKNIKPMPFHKIPFGGGEGICTPVQNTFLFASYSNINGQPFGQPIFCFCFTIKKWSNMFAVQCPKIRKGHHTSISILYQLQYHFHHNISLPYKHIKVKCLSKICNLL